MEIVINKYIDKSGRITIELAWIEGFPWYVFSCSHEFDHEKYPELKNLIEEICFLGTPQKRRGALIKQYFETMLSIPGIRIKLGSKNKKEPVKIVTTLEQTLDYIFAQDDFHEYVPLTEAHNPYFFYILKRRLQSEKYWKEKVEVEKGFFESLIKDKKKLEDAYVEVFSPEAEYFRKKIKVDSVTYEFYFMMVNHELKLIFYQEG